LILGPVHGERHSDHGVDPIRGMPPASVGDAHAALRLLRDRGGDVLVEDRVAEMAQTALEDRGREPLRRRHKPRIVLRKLHHPQALALEIEGLCAEAPRVEGALRDRVPLRELAQRIPAIWRGCPEAFADHTPDERPPF
jgi:hypothetical protein